MISHALTIVLNELNRHIESSYGPSAPPQPAALGNIAEGFPGTSNGSGLSRNMLYFSVVHIMEEKALKNQPNYVINNDDKTALYQNPPVCLNFTVLVTATHTIYSDALLMLSRTIRFFQFKNVFTPETVAPSSLTLNAPNNTLDQLETFKLVFELLSASMEEIHHLWGTLGGKQYPFVLYRFRALDLKFRTEPESAPLISEVINNTKYFSSTDK